MQLDEFLLVIWKCVLQESGLFEIVYKFRYKTPSKDKKKFKSDSVSLTLLKKINFEKKYPENI